MIDYTKPVQTVGGDPVEIITIKGRGNFCVIGYISWGDLPRCWKPNGGYGHRPGPHDLINVPEKPKMIVRWFNVYKDSVGAGYESQETANHYADKNRIACKRVEFTEGEFDE